MASRCDESFLDVTKTGHGLSPAQHRWDAGSPLNTLIDELIVQMGKHLAYLALARAAGFVARFHPAAIPADARTIAIQVLSTLTPQECLVLASEDFQAIEPKAAAIIEQAIFLTSYIHAPPT